MSDDPEGLTAYRVGGGRHRAHWAHRFHVDRWFRSWQAEWDSALTACRAWTRQGVLRRARRWYRHGTDIARHERLYGPNPKARARRHNELRWGAEPGTEPT